LTSVIRTAVGVFVGISLAGVVGLGIVMYVVGSIFSGGQIP